MARVKEVEETEDPFFKQAKEYAFVKKQIEYLEKQQKDLKDQIFTYLESNGEKDANGKTSRKVRKGTSTRKTSS